jgi:hypothetical protein
MFATLKRAVYRYATDTMDWDSEEQISKRRSVDKRGALSDEAYHPRHYHRERGHLDRQDVGRVVALVHHD